MSLEGAVVVICGATGGVGSALCRQLAADGSRLVIAARGADRLNALAQEVGATAMTADATDAAQVDAVFTEAIDRFGRVDAAVNCVGSLLLKPAHLTTPEEWRTTIVTNLDSSFYVVRAAVKAMTGPEARGGAIVLCSSAVARHGFSNHEAIAAAKAGVIGLALSAAATYAAKGVRVNCVAPGLTSTPLTARIVGNEASLKASVAMHANGRIGEAEDVASAIEWLINPRQRHVTGQVIAVDGGLGSLRPR